MGFPLWELKKITGPTRSLKSRLPRIDREIKEDGYKTEAAYVHEVYKRIKKSSELNRLEK